MYWKTEIDLNKTELNKLNDFASEFKGSSEEEVPNCLNQFPSVLQKINQKIDEYLPKDYDKYLAQSWCISLPKEFSVPSNPHNHGYSHFSFVFYTEVNEALPLIIRDVNNIEFEVDVKVNDFIILPNYLIHYIKPDMSKNQRISFAGDLILTEKEYKSSMFLPPISNWTKL
jgi:hypothetical protein